MHAAEGAFATALKFEVGASFWPAKVVRTLAKEATRAVFVEQCVALRIAPAQDADASTDADADVEANSAAGEDHGDGGDGEEEEARGGIVLHTSLGPIRCGRIVVATNAWLPRLLPELAPHFRAATNSVIASAQPLPEELRWPCAAAAWGGGMAEVYISHRCDGRLVVGGLRSEASEPWSGDDDSGVDTVVADKLVGWMEEHFPRLAETLTWERVWRGALAFPRDGKPYVGAVPGRPTGVFVCGGFGGHGMPRCFGHARMAAQLMSGVPMCDLEEAEEAARCDVARLF